MFTGIIQHRAAVREIAPSATGARLALDVAGWPHAPSHGDSIAVNGCCLTVVESKGDLLMFDVIHQTLRCTTLGSLGSGDMVNVEHAATPSTLLGGHIVQGHVDGVGTVRVVANEGGEHRVRIEPPAHLMDYLIKRGSIAVDGVSLTIASVDEASIEVALIPATLELTTIGEKREGDRVNLEADYLAKVAIEWMKRQEIRRARPQTGGQ